MERNLVRCTTIGGNPIETEGRVRPLIAAVRAAFVRGTEHGGVRGKRCPRPRAGEIMGSCGDSPLCPQESLPVAPAEAGAVALDTWEASADAGAVARLPAAGGTGWAGEL